MATVETCVRVGRSTVSCRWNERRRRRKHEKKAVPSLLINEEIEFMPSRT